MKIVSSTIAIVFLSTLAFAQFDPLTNPMVYHEPGMDKVSIQKGIVYKTVHADTVLKLDIYYPALYDKNKVLPVVIFNNGVGSMQLPEWQIYKDWASLMAAHGMIAVTHQSRNGKTQRDLSDLLGYLRTESSKFNLDKDNIAIWVCSGNTPTGWAAANDVNNNFIKTVAIYYGVIPSQERIVKRKDLEILLVRAGLDSHSINSGMEELMVSALQNDAHVEFINYPEGQHAFDGFDNTARSKEIILQTIDFFRRNLLGDNSEPASPIISNRQLWQMVLNQNKTDEGIRQFKIAYEAYRDKPRQSANFNQLLNENNLNGLGYQLLGEGRIDDAIKIFKVNAGHFPSSPNAFDALSDAYEKAGDDENTLANARIALEKLNASTHLPAQFAQAIRQSAETKIEILESPIPYRRAHHELVYDEAGQSIMMISGSTPLAGGQSFKFFNDIWRYDKSGWHRTGVSGDERSGIRLAYDSKRKQLFSYGGFVGRTSKAELRVLEGGAWKVLSDLPEMTSAEGGLVYDSKRDRLIAFGGSASRGHLNNITWEWDGTSWKKNLTAGPEGRQAFAMVYDSKRNKTVLFGGMGASPQTIYEDTWEFDGSQWKKVSTTGPGPRMSCGYAYDSKRGMLMIFGGTSGGKAMGDTWGWNGTAWKKLAESGPTPRMMGYMAYDKARDRIVMFGGRLGWPNDANDTWEWDGIKWAEIKK